MSVTKGMKILEIFARDWRSFPLSFNLLLVFGVIFVMSMVAGARQPASVIVMCVTLLAAYLAVLLPNRRLFALSTDARRLIKFMGLTREERRIRFCIAIFENTQAEGLRGDSFT
jgi:hypothetical protein